MRLQVIDRSQRDHITLLNRVILAAERHVENLFSSDISSFTIDGFGSAHRFAVDLEDHCCAAVVPTQRQ